MRTRALTALLVVLACLVAFAVARAPLRASPGEPDPDLIVIDPGHGGADYGARGRHGMLEKDVVLAVSKRVGKALQRSGFKVLFTRDSDRFVSLPERTDVANRARAALFLSIHANSSPDSSAHGAETYFLSLEASDEEARRVALTENEVFDRPESSADGADLVGAILGDLIRTDHLRASGQVAAAIQRQLAALPGPSRGVKQAPFVVLMGVNMPAALLEIGFLTHAGEEQNLRTAAYQKRIAAAVANALHDYRATAGGAAGVLNRPAAKVSPPVQQEAPAPAQVLREEGEVE